MRDRTVTTLIVLMLLFSACPLVSAAKSDTDEGTRAIAFDTYHSYADVREELIRISDEHEDVLHGVTEGLQRLEREETRSSLHIVDGAKHPVDGFPGRARTLALHRQKVGLYGIEMLAALRHELGDQTVVDNTAHPTAPLPRGRTE